MRGVGKARAARPYAAVAAESRVINAGLRKLVPEFALEIERLREEREQSFRDSVRISCRRTAGGSESN
jgi:hypothetical protein